MRAARRLAADALGEAGYRGDVETVLLLVSELATNAVHHAGTDFELRVRVEAGDVTVTVVDHDRAHAPELRHPDPEDLNGRGLLIVDHLAAAWGSGPAGADAKEVWFRCVAGDAEVSDPAPATEAAVHPARVGRAKHPSARQTRR